MTCDSRGNATGTLTLGYCLSKSQIIFTITITITVIVALYYVLLDMVCIFVYCVCCMVGNIGRMPESLARSSQGQVIF